MTLYTELSKVHKIVELVHVHVLDHGIYEIVFSFSERSLPEAVVLQRRTDV